ncbi:hypothetical protein ACIBK8_25545 [Streptomyces sp. NPDC050161]|uniref:hypothetical protein n=1 Tax=Streptomyces sp. NPDC050161 TaxID=3365604 RepID=UPI0037A4A85D
MSAIPVFDAADRSRPPRPQAPGLHLVLTPYDEIHTPSGMSRWTVDFGSRVYLLDGGDAVAVAELVDDRDAQPRRQAAAIAEITPWARSVAHLAHAWRLDDRRNALEELRAHEGYVTVYREESGTVASGYDRAAWERRLRAFAAPEDPEGLEGYDLGVAIAQRLVREHRVAADAARDALPAAGQPLPPLSARWTVAWNSRGPLPPWAEFLLPLLGQRWQDAPGTEARDHLIHWAARSGSSKADLHRATGVARTTINRVLGGQDPDEDTAPQGS